MTYASGEVFDDQTGAIISMVLLLPFLWVMLAIAAKRWHDRDKSGWWNLVVFVPLLGPIIGFIEYGCLRGTAGPNRFGEDSSIRG